MAKIKLKPHIKSIHGRIGNMIYYNIKGFQYARAYTIPANPRTERQQSNRASFSEAVKEWQSLPAREKSLYNSLAEGKPLSGYNLFISMYLQGFTLSVLKSPLTSQILKRQGNPSYMKALNSVIDTTEDPWCYIHLCTADPPGIIEAIKQSQPRLMSRAA